MNPYRGPKILGVLVNRAIFENITIPTYEMMIKASHSSRMAKDLRGFGNLSLLVCGDCC